MTLTPENLESRDGILGTPIYRDLGRMNEDQLETYVRKAFLGERDLDFLPPPFWDYYFRAGIHGENPYNEKAPGSPAGFFAGVHDTIGSDKRGTFSIGREGEEKPDFGYRRRIRNVIKKLLSESLDVKGKPTQEQKRIASFAVETAGVFKSAEIFRLIGNDIVEERRRYGQNISSEYPQELREDLVQLEADRGEMLAKAEILMRDSRFGKLKLTY